MRSSTFWDGELVAGGGERDGRHWHQQRDIGERGGFDCGKVGQAFIFAGSGEAVQLGNPTDLQLQDFTIETWIQRGSASSSTLDPGQTTAIFMAYGYDGYGFGIYDDGSLFLTRVGIDAVTIPNLITDTNWHHVALTKAGTNVVFYVDGVSYPAPILVHLGVQF